jgi:ribA/ribD-fused uncharacterized protein
VIPFFGDWDKFNEKKPMGSNDTGFLSNFFLIPNTPIVSFMYGGEVFHADNVEVPFQVLKCHILGTPTARQWDQQTVKQLIMTLTPDESKQLGRQNFAFNQSYLWGMELIMETLVRQKFTSFESLEKALEATGEAHLVEGNKWNDSNWGMPFDGTTLRPGCNKLGKILMKIRDENRKGSPAATPISIEDLKRKIFLSNR